MGKIIKSLSILFLFLIACMPLFQGCATPLASPGQPEVPFPTMEVGDTFVITGLSCLQEYGPDPFTLKIIEVKPDGSFVYEAQGAKTKVFYLYYNNKYQLEKIIDINTKKEKKTYIPHPPAKHLVFPLFVGKKWRDSFVVRARASGEISGDNLFSVTSSYTVVQYETIYTKAGSFKAFRINRRSDVSLIGATGFEQYWYAPEVKCIVKYERSWMHGGELISYKLAAKNWVH